MDRLAQFATGKRSRWAVLAAWLLLAAVLAPLQGSLQRVAADESDAFVAASAESTRLDHLVDTRFSAGNEVNTVIAYRPADDPRILTDAQKLCAKGTLSSVVRVITPNGLACGKFNDIGPSSPAVGAVTPQRDVALVTVQTRDDATQVVEKDVAAIRAIVPDTALVTGETAFAADQSAAVEGIDGTLLAITAVLILVLLLIVYRSPIAAAVPLVIVSLAYIVAAGAIYGLAKQGLKVTGQATAILIVLMFGAGTDYCLLLISRFKEELRQGNPEALRAATRRSAPTMLSAGGIVVAAMLVLTLADYRATSTMGPVLAVGTAVTVLAGLTLLPALLAILGRYAFWPATPREAGRTWPAIGRLVRARPGVTILAVGALLIAGALGALDHRPPLSFADSFRDPPESVQAQDLIAKRYEPGLLGPATAVVEARDSGTVLEELSHHTPGVFYAAAEANSRDGKLTLINILTTADPFSQAAQDATPALRAKLREGAHGHTALLGGVAAEQYDARAALSSDAKLIVPLTLILVLAIIGLLLRAVIAPLYLVATVVLSYAFALGVASLLFDATDPALPTFAFVFLVALGVDYNVFLISRIREEREHRDSRDAVISGLERSGGVITSAGLILAGTFLALVAVDMVSLAQVGFTVALGLLVDTFLVRCFLVPAIAVKLGDRSWWPLHPAIAIVMVAAVLFAIAVPGVASAETFTVRSVADDGPGTLREALEAAEATTEADVIDVRATGVVQLRTQLPDLHTTLTVDGPGAERLSVARSSAAALPFRVLTIAAGGDVRMSGLTLTGGYVAERSSPRGGGVLNQGRLALSEMVIAGNAVEGQIGVTAGGGVSTTGTLELLDSVVRDNHVVSGGGEAVGGGVHNLGTLLVARSTVTGNTGSGVEQAAGVATLRGATVTANAGDGIHNDFADLVVEDTTVAGNAAQISAIGGKTEVRRSSLNGPGVNLWGQQVDIPSWLTVEGTTLTGGRPDCALHVQVIATWRANRVDDESCPANEAETVAPMTSATATPGLAPPAVAAPAVAAPVVTAPPARLAPLRVTRAGTTLRVTVAAAGTLRLRGAGVRAVTRRAGRAGVLRLAVRSTRRTAHIRLTFRPVQGGTQERRLTIHLRKTRWGRGTE